MTFKIFAILFSSVLCLFVPASNKVTVSAIGERGALFGTLLGGIAAAGAERAAGRHVQRTRHVALEDDALARSGNIGVRNRHRRQQRLRIRMLRVFVQFICIGNLDDLAEIHDCDALGNVPRREGHAR